MSQAGLNSRWASIVCTLEQLLNLIRSIASPAVLMANVIVETEALDKGICQANR